jgi:hypothetical protein
MSATVASAKKDKTTNLIFHSVIIASLIKTFFTVTSEPSYDGRTKAYQNSS